MKEKVEVKEYNKYMLPLSIVIAGIIIAGSIYLSSKAQNNTSNPQKTNKTTTSTQTNSTTSNNSIKATVSLGTNPILGNKKTAKVAIVEFGDFQCPYCKNFDNSTFPLIKDNYINNGKVLFAFRDYPLETLHPLALGMAVESRCFAEQGKYWQFVNKMYSTSQNNNTASVVLGYAKNMHLNIATYQSCVSKDTFLSQIKADISTGNNIGIQGTPTFIIGKLNKGKITGQLILGAYPFSYFQGIINQYLN